MTLDNNKPKQKENKMKQDNLFGFEVYTIEGFDHEKNCVIPSEKIFISETYDVNCPKANREFNFAVAKYEKKNNVHYLQRQYAKGFKIISYLNEGK